MPPEVYFFPCTRKDTLEHLQNGMKELLNRTAFTQRLERNDAVAVKIHFGEEGNRGHVSPDLLSPIILEIRSSGGRPFLTDTNTLYTGRRSNGVDHLILACEHGFTPERTGAPVLIADGLFGDDGVDVPLEGSIIGKASIARDIHMAQGLVSISHLTGHLATGFGACLKNLGMGCATRKGKMVQHSSMKPRVAPKKCEGCETCVELCPAGSIEMVEGRAVIQSDGCIGCGQCVATCRFNAVIFDWGETAERLQMKMVDYAMAALATKGQKAVHITALTHITRECDCLARDEAPLCDDIGMLASNDPVALDQASVDLVLSSSGRSLASLSNREDLPVVQTVYAESRGLGSRTYSLTHIS
ncbi:MAG TPA: DUF362 domain-containing protein [Thermoanaerobaculia bacterium]|nr:DUF362 domain-containing protein [Thermoanaerobaculia bacterium]HUM29933.1 DUF362 domain-containing protein [Thermoanaerobaculia bacterium]HXK68200.1 DUF362 domain-containing protein [Thermoanaerobaculia bacterium]